MSAPEGVLNERLLSRSIRNGRFEYEELCRHQSRPERVASASSRDDRSYRHQSEPGVLVKPDQPDPFRASHSCSRIARVIGLGHSVVCRDLDAEWPSFTSRVAQERAMRTGESAQGCV